MLVKNNNNNNMIKDINIKNEIPKNLKIALCSLKERLLKLDEIKKSLMNTSKSIVLGKKKKLNPQQVVAKMYRN